MINQLQRYCQSNCFHSLSFFALCLSIGVRLCEPSLPLFVLTGCRVTTVTSYSICSGVQSFQYWVAQNWLTKKLYTVFLKRNLFNVEIRWTERFISMICITNSSQNYTKRAVSPYTDWCTPTTPLFKLHSGARKTYLPAFACMLYTSKLRLSESFIQICWGKIEKIAFFHFKKAYF